jgi:hypothetical protein
LELHPDKTRLIEFGRFAARDRKARGEGKPETFTFLGFTHYCGQRHKSGTFTAGLLGAISDGRPYRDSHSGPEVRLGGIRRFRK